MGRLGHPARSQCHPGTSQSLDPTKFSFFFSGRSPKEHPGTRCWAPNQEATSLPTGASVLLAATQVVLKLSVSCALTPSPSFGPASKDTDDNTRKQNPASSNTCLVYTHFICRNPLAPLSKTAPHICIFCFIRSFVSFLGGGWSLKEFTIFNKIIVYKMQ